MTFQQKVVYAFNNFYLAFLTDLKKYNEDFKQAVRRHYKVFDKGSSAHFERMQAAIDQAKSAGAEDESIEIIPELTMAEILEVMKNDVSDVKSVRSYDKIFRAVVLMYDYSDDTILEKALAIIKGIQMGADVSEQMTEILDDDLAAVLRDLKGLLDASGDKAGGGSADGAKNPFEMLENSKIGSLAKEISGEIDLSSIGSPEQLLDFKNLTGSNNVLGNIISKVSDKIQNKISSGEISQTDLVNEALSFMGMVNGGGGASGGAGGGFDAIFNNPMLGDIMKSMSGMNMGGGNAGGSARVDTNKLNKMASSAATRDRLRQKLEKKKAAAGNPPPPPSS